MTIGARLSAASLSVADWAAQPVAMYIAGGAVTVAMATGLGLMLMRGHRGYRIGSPEDAAEAVEAALAGVRVAGAVVGADGAGALAVTDDGRVAAVKRLGKRLIAREIVWRSVRSTATGILIETDDPRLGNVALAGVNVLDIRRLAPQLPARFRASAVPARSGPTLAAPARSSPKVIAH